MKKISNICRVCGRKLFGKPLLRYENMPKSAQYLPDKETLKNDKGVVLEVCQCSGCGLVQLNNKPVPYYREVIRASGFSKEMIDFRNKQFKDFVKKYNLKNKKIIEIGCGKGEYSQIMSKYSANTFGFDGYIEKSDYKIKNYPYDAFFIMNFLEHLPNINDVLGGIYNNLSDNSVGIVEVPNFDMILKNNLFSEFVVDHLFYFTKETLENILKLNGFDILESEIVWHDYIISVVVKKRKILDLSKFYDCQNILKMDIEKYISKYKRVAIWGAGHQALAIMAMMNLGNKIKYVIDSATFKQGKYTPSTHIPIVAPDYLISNPVDAVLVMAAGYSDEVVKIIRQKFDKNIDVKIF